MLSNEEIIQRLMEKVSDQIVRDLNESLTSVVEQEIKTSISRMLLEGEFYRRLNTDMHTGLKAIYKEISLAHVLEAEGETPDSRETNELFSEASKQLDKILETTETATEQIMDIVERHMELQAESASIIGTMKDGCVAPNAADRLREINDTLGADLMQVMTTLSFQDITGQRIKRIIDALKRVEGITFDLFMSTGLKMKAKEKHPEQNLDELDQTAQKQVSELKGPQGGVSQGDVDDLLSQLGLE